MKVDKSKFNDIIKRYENVKEDALEAIKSLFADNKLCCIDLDNFDTEELKFHTFTDEEYIATINSIAIIDNTLLVSNTNIGRNYDDVEATYLGNKLEKEQEVWFAEDEITWDDIINIYWLVFLAFENK